MKQIAEDCVSLLNQITQNKEHSGVALLPNGSVEIKVLACASPQPDLYDDPGLVDASLSLFVPGVEIISVPSQAVRIRLNGPKTDKPEAAVAREGREAPANVDGEKWYRATVKLHFSDRNHKLYGCGWVTIEELGGDAFYHKSVLDRQLRVDDIVEVRLKDTVFKNNKLPDCAQVRLVTQASSLPASKERGGVSSSSSSGGGGGGGGLRYKPKDYMDSTTISKLQESTIPCPQCGKSFFAQPLLDQHILVKHTTKPAPTEEELEQARIQDAANKLQEKLASSVPATIALFIEVPCALFHTPSTHHSN